MGDATPTTSSPTMSSKAWDTAVDLTNRVGDKVLKLIDRGISRQSSIPTTPFLDPADFPWTRPLEANWETIRAELDAVLERMDALPAFQEISTDQYNLTDDDRWKTFFLYGYGFRSDANCARCPETDRLVRAIPGMQTAMFSILAPHKRIPPHDGPYKGVVRYHLGLRVPADPQLAGIRVGPETAHWQAGGSLVFDDTYAHEAWNDSDEVRVVLFVDFVRPLRQPMKAFNAVVLKAIGYSPFIQDAKRRHRAWERRFAALERDGR
jgi:beta-hydroxylase